MVDIIKSSKVDKNFFVMRQLRQYGVASLHEREASVASYTGMFTSGTRGSSEAASVSVQGNILENGDVLDETLAHFVNSPKSCRIAVALLKALEPGAREGGDSRCSAERRALSAFLTDAQPGDSEDAPAIRLIVPNQQRGGANPVLMRREQLRHHFAEQSISLDDCTLQCRCHGAASRFTVWLLARGC